MLNRRHVLSLGAGAGALVAGPTTLTLGSRSARAQGRPLTFCSWGGALSELEKTALLDPFAKAKNIEIAHASPTNYAKISPAGVITRFTCCPNGWFPYSKGQLTLASLEGIFWDSSDGD